jgi:hypothetical protein
MSDVEGTIMESVEAATNAITISDDKNNAILIEAPSTDNTEASTIRYCNGGKQGWCKNVCKEGQSICDECTKMMESHP